MNQSIQFYLYSTTSQITHFSQEALQCVQHNTPPETLAADRQTLPTTDRYAIDVFCIDTTNTNKAYYCRL